MASTVSNVTPHEPTWTSRGTESDVAESGLTSTWNFHVTPRSETDEPAAAGDGIGVASAGTPPLTSILRWARPSRDT